MEMGCWQFAQTMETNGGFGGYRPATTKAVRLEKGMDQVIKRCRHEASIGHSIYKRKLIFAPCLKPTSLKK